MKRVIFSVLVLSVFLCSCQRNDVQESVRDYDVLQATIGDLTSTRTVMDEDNNILWSDGDMIVVFMKAPVGQKYQIETGSVGKTSGYFSKMSSDSPEGSGDGAEWGHNVAYYPYSEAVECVESDKGYILDVVLPAGQAYATESFGNSSFPMVAVSEDNDITFRNVLGGMKLQLKGTQRVKSITLQGKNNEKLSGAATVVAYTDSEFKPTITMSSDASTSVTLDCGAEGVQLNETTATEFIIALPPVVFTEGFTVTITDGDGKTGIVETDKENTVLRSSLLIMPAVTIATAPPTGTQQKSFISNGDMEEDISLVKASRAEVGKWNYLGGWNAGVAQVKQEDGKGVDGSRCISIQALSADTDVMFAQRVTGLTPGGYYKATAKIRTEMVSGGKGANLCLDYLWAPASAGLLGSNPEWQNVEFEIDDAPESGEIILCLRLGNTAASSKGLVYFDDVTFSENDELYIRSSDHLRLVVDKETVSVSDEVIDEWLGNLDKVYEAYKEFFGGMVPFEGKITTIRAATIGAWAYAGNPIQWNRNYISETLRTVARGDWCFGIMHEIGHNFAPYMSNGTYTFDWNEELFANFRMFYALEKLNATVITTASVPKGNGTYISQEKTYIGAGLLQLYKSETTNCYDRTIGAGRAVEMGNALCYKLIQIKEKYGWDVYKKAFAELYGLPRNQEEEQTMNHWERFEYFLSFLTKHAGEDVHSCFTTAELNTIKAYLSTQK